MIAVVHEESACVCVCVCCRRCSFSRAESSLFYVYIWDLASDTNRSARDVTHRL